MKVDLTLTFSDDRCSLENEIQKKHFVDCDLQARVYENVFCLPPKFDGSRFLGGLFDENHRKIDGSGFYSAAGYWYDSSDSIVTLDGDYVFLGWIHHSWGHSYTDGLKHLWYIKTQECRERIKRGAKIVYLYTKNCVPYENIINLFNYAGVDLSECMLITHPTIIKNCIIPDECLRGDFDSKIYTKEYVEIIEEIKNKIEICTLKYPKVYFSRTQVNDCLKRDHGELCIEKAFEKKGYKIIYPEKITTKEQLSILKQCSFFAATEGSVSHNSIFCGPKTEVAIIRKCNFVNVYQIIVNEVANLKVVYIDSHKSINLLDDMKYRGPFYLYLSENLKSYLGDIGWIYHYPYWLMPSWWYQRNFNRRVVRKIESFCKKIF